jgi:hypothetical protein
MTDAQFAVEDRTPGKTMNLRATENLLRVLANTDLDFLHVVKAGVVAVRTDTEKETLATLREMVDVDLLSHCESCATDFVVPVDDKAQGQLCPSCMAKGPLFVLTCGELDDDPRFFAGLPSLASWLEDCYYGEWYEFSEAEYDFDVEADWDKLPKFDISSLDALRRTVAERMAFLTGFWQRHDDILSARDSRRTRPTEFKWSEVPVFEAPTLTEVK